ncbi:hypothetical protein [Parerythrobacter jejuensis]|uniref:Uncharacterized protein n=1 Tax=Parerythrobacter jejuensis TaxID=795812 RepID=A0A845AU36_9SPHN|nr:hypothetical protein [Parerythrobacter jejuensis]MXP30259.1 hypothetical protein [Parerythrobacter jejuensis]MXP33019.1 hypothetical protein [Parerythrobacter jejuensis]
MRTPVHTPSPDIAGDEQFHRSPRNMASRVKAGLRFFTRRGKLDLTRDSSQHRRYAFLYEDMMN